VREEVTKSQSAQGPAEFFNAMRKNFARILAQGKGDPRLIDVLAAQAGDNYERNVAIQSEGLPPHACGKGCETCCCLQVAATAPEIFHAAHFIRVTGQALPHMASISRRGSGKARPTSRARAMWSVSSRGRLVR